MKVALAQLDMGFEEKAAAMDICIQMIANAKAQYADLIVFPEMTLTGFSMSPQTYGETPDNSPTVAFFQQQAKQNEIAIVFGVIFLTDHTAKNHSIVISKTGEILADYAKIHPFSYGAEAKYYTGGDHLAFCSLENTTLSPFICYDLRFPEIFQAASKKSHLITVIANWPVARIAHWKILLQTRAIETQSFLIGVNRSGKDRTLTYSGDSMLVSPTGEILAHLTKINELAVVDIDPNQAAEYRKTFPLKADRKETLYCRFFTEQN